MNSLSVIIITKNEAENIVACLETVRFADEIIVLDSASTDETVALAKQFTPNVYQTDWPGFGVQKNRALEKCTSDWILSLDADERLSEELQYEIKSLLTNDSFWDAYEIPRKSTYCDQFIAYGDWRHDYCIRLFKKGYAHFKDLPVHESLVVNGRIGRLRGDIIHYSFSTLEEVLNKMNAYSTLSAEYKYKQGKKAKLFTAILHGAWTFFRSYFLKLGFLDGQKGFMLAVSNAEGCYYRYLKIMLLEERRKKLI